MLKKLFVTVILTLSFIIHTQNVFAADIANSPVNVQEIFTSTKTIEGNNFSYPDGISEMRLYKIDVDAGGQIPLHFHPAPLTGFIQEGQLTLRKEKGRGQTFKAGDSFILGPETPPHTMGNTGKDKAVMWVVVASAEDLPSQIFIE